MVDKLPVDLTAGSANRDSLVHATDFDVGELSRAHSEASISRLQGAANPFNTSIAYLIGDIVEESGAVFRAILDNGPGNFTESDWFTISEIQTKTDVTNLADQAITATGDTDIVGMTITLTNSSSKFAIITFNINYIVSQNDKDVVFRVNDGGVVVNDYSKFGGLGGDLQGMTITYVAELLGQVVKAVCARDGGANPSGTITIIGATPPSTSFQALQMD